MPLNDIDLPKFGQVYSKKESKEDETTFVVYQMLFIKRLRILKGQVNTPLLLRSRSPAGQEGSLQDKC